MSKTNDEKLREIIGQAMGFASLCWDPKPTGVFKSDCAAAHLDHVMKEIESLQSPHHVNEGQSAKPKPQLYHTLRAIYEWLSDPEGPAVPDEKYHLIVNAVMALKAYEESPLKSPTDDWLERERQVRIQALEAEIQKTYKAWCGRNLMHLLLNEAVGQRVMALEKENAELKARLEGTNG